MDIYYIVLFISFLLLPFDYLDNTLLRKAIYTFFCGFIIFLPAMRQVGIDHDSLTYGSIFETITEYSYVDIITGNYWENIERGFALFNKLIRSSGGDIHTLLVTTAILTGLINYIFFYKFSPYPFFSVFFYLCFFYLYRDFTQIRYGLSCSIVFWAVFFYSRKRYGLFISLLTLAIIFHNTAFIFLLALPFANYLKSKLFYFLFPFVCLVGFVINPFPVLLKLGFVPAHMSIYLNEEGGAGLAVSVLSYFIMLLYLSYSKKFGSNLDLFFRLVAISCGLNILFIHSAIFQRFSYSFFQFGILLLASIFYKLERTESRSYVLLIRLLVCVLFLLYGIKLIEPDLIKPYMIYES